MHLAPAPGFPASLPMQAVVHNTPPGYTSPWVMPGHYTVKLTVDGQSYTRPLTIGMDPRVKTPRAGLMEQFTLSKQMYDGLVKTSKALEEIRGLRAQLDERKARAQGAAADAIAAYQKQLEALEGSRGSLFAFFRGGASGPATLTTLRFGLSGLMGMLQEADVAPTMPQVAAARKQRQTLEKLMAQWMALKTTGLARVNAALKAANLAPITLPEKQM
jgi:hypothetical protein